MVIFTTCNSTWTKLKKLIKSNPTDWKVKRISRAADTHELVYVEVVAPKGLLTFREKKKNGHPLSTEQKKAVAERFAKARANK